MQPLPTRALFQAIRRRPAARPPGAGRPPVAHPARPLLHGERREFVVRLRAQPERLQSVQSRGRRAPGSGAGAAHVDGAQPAAAAQAGEPVAAHREWGSVVLCGSIVIFRSRFFCFFCSPNHCSRSCRLSRSIACGSFTFARLRSAGQRPMRSRTTVVEPEPRGARHRIEGT